MNIPSVSKIDITTGGGPVMDKQKTKVETIKPRSGWRSVNFGELWEYRDLIYFMVWRDIKARYAQSVLGVGWAIIQPLLMMIVFTMVFGKLAGLDSDGVPYPIFAYAALVPWTFFANSFTESTGSLIRNADMVKKIYFPRIVVPLASVIGKLVDFLIAMVVLGALMAWYGIAPTWPALALPLLVLIMFLSATGLGMVFTALAVQYRDVSYGLGFGIQMLMYTAPVVYSINQIPDQYRLLYGLNPMVGVIEGFRASLVGTTAMPWDLIGISAATSALIVIVGAAYFRRMEKIFADVA